jgi:hypothetical protein
MSNHLDIFGPALIASFSSAVCYLVARPGRRLADPAAQVGFVDRLPDCRNFACNGVHERLLLTRSAKRLTPP